MGTLRDVFWQRDRHRLRAPWRFVGTLSLFFLAVIVLAALGRWLAGLVGGGPLTWLVLGVVLLVASWVLVVVAWVVDRRPARDLGLALDRYWRLDAAVGFLVGLLMATAVVGVGLATGRLAVIDTLGAGDAALVVDGVGPVAATALWLAFFVGVGTIEEVVVRGYVLVNVAEGVRGWVGRRGAVLVAVGLTAGLFGVLHAANPGGTALGLVNITLAGVLLGGSYALTGRLGLAVGIHIAWNFAVGPVYGLPVSGLETSPTLLRVRSQGSTLVTGGSFGPEGGLLMLVALAVGAALVLWWVRQQEGELRLQDHIAEPDLRPYPDSRAEGEDGDGDSGGSDDETADDSEPAEGDDTNPAS